MICDTCNFLIDSVDEVDTPMGSFLVHTHRCKKRKTCGGEWCDTYEGRDKNEICNGTGAKSV